MGLCIVVQLILDPIGREVNKYCSFYCENVTIFGNFFLRILQGIDIILTL